MEDDANQAVPQPGEVVAAAACEPAASEPAWAEPFRELAAEVREANRLSRERERVIDRLHEENQRLRAGELHQALDPVWRDLIRLYDDMSKTAEAYAQRALPPEVLQDLECYREWVEQILDRQGVDRLAPAEGDAFNPAQHHARAAVRTAEPARDRTVARLVRAGFQRGARLVRPADVEVYRFQAEEIAGSAPAGS